MSDHRDPASQQRVPVFLLARHKEALAAVARSFGCPEARLLDEAVALYLKQLERLGVAQPAAAEAQESAHRHGDAFWSAVLR